MYRNEERFRGDPTQLYETQARDVECLVRHLAELFPGLPPRPRVFEPCCGRGAIVRALAESGIECSVMRDKHTLEETHDFLEAALPDPEAWDMIITNPPFAGKLDWWRRLEETGKPFAVLYPLDLLSRLRHTPPVSEVVALITPWNPVFVRGGKTQAVGCQVAWLCSSPVAEGREVPAPRLVYARREEPRLRGR
jgi:hypothetical protein